MNGINGQRVERSALAKRLRGVALSAVCAAALGACSGTEKAGSWTEDATSWTRKQVRPASATAGPVEYNVVGIASWYGPKHHGKPTASGDSFDMNAMTAAHRTLPYGTKVRVTNLSNGRSIVVTINDRGPRLENRIIDLSKAAAARLGFMRKGITRVRIQAVEPAQG